MGLLGWKDGSFTFAKNKLMSTRKGLKANWGHVVISLSFSFPCKFLVIRIRLEKDGERERGGKNASIVCLFTGQHFFKSSNDCVVSKRKNVHLAITKGYTKLPPYVFMCPFKSFRFYALLFSRKSLFSK